MRGIFKKIFKTLYPIMPIGFLRKTLLIWCGYKIGKHVYLPSSLRISDLKTSANNIIIGDRVSIGPGVLIITDSSPNHSRLLKIFPLKSGKVIIEEDAWIGANAILLPGITIGKCSIIGAGSVVIKNVSNYSIVGGVPAKEIRKINSHDL